jgi:hypothetical protein
VKVVFEFLVGLAFPFEVGLQDCDLLLDLEEIQDAHRQSSEDGRD